MNCSCVAVDYDCDWVDLVEKTKPVARKKHRCVECDRDILPGEKYEIQKYVFEGEFETHKTCSECVEIRDMFSCEGYRYGSILNDFEDDLINADCDLSESCIAELSLKAREIVCEMIEGCWELRIVRDDFA